MKFRTFWKENKKFLGEKHKCYVIMFYFLALTILFKLIRYSNGVDIEGSQLERVSARNSEQPWMTPRQEWEPYRGIVKGSWVFYESKTPYEIQLAWVESITPSKTDGFNILRAKICEFREPFYVIRTLASVDIHESRVIYISQEPMYRISTFTFLSIYIKRAYKAAFEEIPRWHAYRIAKAQSEKQKQEEEIKLLLEKQRKAEARKSILMSRKPKSKPQTPSAFVQTPQ